MLEVMLYLIASYLCVAVISSAGLVWCRKRASGARWPYLSALMLLPVLPYVVVESQTALFGRALLPAVRGALRQEGFADRVVAFKLLSVWPHVIRVFAVTPCMPYDGDHSDYRAVVVRLRATARGWQSDGDAQVPWSDCGSANGNVFPPYAGKGEYATAVRSAAKVRPRPVVPRLGRSPFVVVGYLDPSVEDATAALNLAGGWSARQGWVEARWERFPPEWQVSSWQLFARPGAKPASARGKPAPNAGDGMDGPSYELESPWHGGVAVAGAMRPQPRRARPERPDRPELRASTRELLRRHGVQPPARPRILAAWRVDLDGDGDEEVLWTARSREGWGSPYPNTPGGPRVGDYALLGLRFLDRGRVRSVALALDAAKDPAMAAEPAWYQILCPLDIDGNGQMEILAHRWGFEEQALIVCTFDGRRVVGVLGTKLP